MRYSLIKHLLSIVKSLPSNCLNFRGCEGGMYSVETVLWILNVESFPGLVVQMAHFSPGWWAAALSGSSELAPRWQEDGLPDTRSAVTCFKNAATMHF